MSLRKDIEALKIGESMTIKGPRAAAYTAASRARVFISTKETEEGWTEITRKENEAVGGVVSNPKHSTSLEIAIATVLSLSTTDRLELLGHLELCCGMNLGECICPDEEITLNVQAEAPHDEKLARARAIMAQFEENEGKLPVNPVVSEEETTEEWVFVGTSVQFADDGNAYRGQILLPHGKKRRSVQVDPENHGSIIRIV